MTVPENEWVALCVVTQPHGVRGQVKVKSFSEPEDGFGSYSELTDESGKSISLRITGQAQGQFIVTIAGITDRNQAELWRGKKIGAVKNAMSKKKSAHRYYVSDLMGLDVVDAAGKPVGVVKSVANYGAGDLLEITHTEGNSEYYAFTHANFPDVDMKARRVTFIPPELLGSRDEEEGAEVNLPLEGGGRSAAEGGGEKPFSKRTVENAHALRLDPTDAEKALWQQLRNEQLGVKFRRQQPIGRYIVDFLATEKKLVLEVDGGQHQSTIYEKERSEFLAREGYQLLRFWNHEVLANMEGVLETIRARIDHPHLASPLKGEG